MELYDISQWRIAGLMGVALYLGSYAALQTGMIRGNGYAYAALNLAASSLVLISLFQDFNLSSALIQVSWIVISTIGIIRLWYLQNLNRFSERDLSLVRHKMRDLPADLARKLLKTGNWVSIPKGKFLTQQGEPAPALYFINRGTAEVVNAGKVVASAIGNDFIGEMTCFSHEPATADVVAQTELEVFLISKEALVKIAPTGSAMRQAIELAVANDLRSKLARRGEALEHLDKSKSGEGARLLNDLDLLTAA